MFLYSRPYVGSTTFLLKMYSWPCVGSTTFLLNMYSFGRWTHPFETIHSSERKPKVRSICHPDENSGLGQSKENWLCSRLAIFQTNWETDVLSWLRKLNQIYFLSSIFDHWWSGKCMEAYKFLFVPAKQVLSESGIINEKNGISDAFNNCIISAGFLFERNCGLIDPGQSIDCSSLCPPLADLTVNPSTSSQSLFSFQQFTMMWCVALLKIDVK